MYPSRTDRRALVGANWVFNNWGGKNLDFIEQARLWAKSVGRWLSGVEDPWLQASIAQDKVTYNYYFGYAHMANY